MAPTDAAKKVVIGAGKLPNTWKIVERRRDGASYRRTDGLVVILSVSEEDDGRTWLHASMSRKSRLPTYQDMVAVKHLFIGDDRYAYQVFAPKAMHVNIHSNCLHLFAPLEIDDAVLPDFTRGSRSI
jgi:hypothetical protein